MNTFICTQSNESESKIKLCSFQQSLNLISVFGKKSSEDMHPDYQRVIYNLSIIVKYYSTLVTGKGRCFDFRVPYISAGEAKLCLNGTSVDSDDYVFSACKTVLIKQNSLMTFIQTDKPIYKPGQKGEKNKI